MEEAAKELFQHFHVLQVWCTVMALSEVLKCRSKELIAPDCWMRERATSSPVLLHIPPISCLTLHCTHTAALSNSSCTATGKLSEAKKGHCSDVVHFSSFFSFFISSD